MGFFDSLWGGIEDLWSGVADVGKSIAGAGADFLAGSGIPIVSGIGAAASNMINKDEAKKQHASDLKFNAEQAQLNRDWQMSERLASQDFNVQMWNMNNDYNSTQKQLERYMAAGGNPNTFFGGASSSVAQPVSTSPGGTGGQAAIGDGFASQMLTSDAVVQNLISQSKLTDIKAEREQYGLSWDKMTAPLRLEALKNANKESQERIRKIIAEVGNIEFNQDLQSAMYEWYAAKTTAEIEEIHKRLVVLHNQSAKLAAEYDQIEAQTEGIKYDNVEKRIRAEVAAITGAPADTPLGNLMFLLYKEGRINDMNIAVTTTMIANGGYTGALSGVGSIIGSSGAKLKDSVVDKSSKLWRKSRYGVINPY